jgi:hypothetical protein
LSLLDDLTAETIERMKAEGFEPAAVVETSLNNFQVWLNHGEILAAAISMAAAKAPVERFGGDPSSADWRHFGRLAGFTNPKPERQPASGLRHRADLAWAKQAAGRGLTLDKIRNELFNGRDLSKKGNRKRQLEYVARTAEKALRSL